MPKFKHYDYKQSTMIVINFEDQLQPGTFEYTLHYLIDQKLDLAVFYPSYHNDDVGRPAYDPAILLKIILFAYSKGITSSREIQWSCETNTLFMALSCNTVPHFTTIASFVSSYSDEIAELFEQIVLICDEEGLLGHEILAIDGCKLKSDAAKEWSGTFKELEAKQARIQSQIQHHMAEHRRCDSNDTRDEDRQRRSAQAIETLEKAHDRIEQFLKTSSPRMGQGRRPREVKSNITDNESAKMKTSNGIIQGYNGIAAVDKKHQIIVEAQAIGEGPEQGSLVPIVEGVYARYRRTGIKEDPINDGPIITADTGFASEANNQYLQSSRINAYIPDNQFRVRDPRFKQQKAKYGHHHVADKKTKHSTFSANEFTVDVIAETCVCPAGELLALRGRKADPYGNQKLFFQARPTQCRDCALNDRCLRNPKSLGQANASGRQVSFIVENRKANYTEWMKHRVDSDAGKRIYGHRMSVVEPVFGNITSNKRLSRFSLRSRKKVNGQWLMYCMIHNIEKLQKYSAMAA